MALSLPGRLLFALAALALLALGAAAVVSVPMGVRGFEHGVAPVTVPNQGATGPSGPAVNPAVQAPAGADTGTGAGSVRNSTPVHPGAPPPTAGTTQTAPPAAPPAAQGYDRCGGTVPARPVKRPPITACQAT